MYKRLNIQGQQGFSYLLPIVVIAAVLVSFAGWRVLHAKDTASTKQALANANTNSPDCSPAFEFTAAPFDISGIRLASLDKESSGGDPRFMSLWLAGKPVNLYAPASGTLTKIRYKVTGAGKEYGVYFKTACGSFYRFNHITDLQPYLKAAYAGGGQPSITSNNQENQALEVPKTAVKVTAGKLLGSTAGIDGSFSMVVASAKTPGSQALTVCPFSVFNEPLKTQLMDLLGPPGGSPQPGYSCSVPAQPF